ncbi:DUF1864 family protein [Glycomyces luteolus]|uniref:DUF1864 family protein n=1 Tax=Glycomyces luteolus TaxID=2670330 RepID=A0A9X3PAK2_9ACTN|nr:monodechloroaminopyrrolnitrin synthase PrnB family protein [Glycomyces luteolus]MDA1361866.1 DUF1864 family protein [Glycomyces luteolus]
MTEYHDPQLAQQIRALDPLRADELLADLPKLNRAGDRAALAMTLTLLVDNGLAQPARSLPEANAAMRDLGMVLSSVRRHGDEPVEAVPRLEALLLDLADRTGLVPRDMILHYTVWNPTGDRERTFTGDPMERALIESVRLVGDDLEAAIRRCDRILAAPSLEAVPPLLLDELAADLQCMVDSMDMVIDEVRPEFFFTDIRPYLDPVLVEGKSYYGAAAAQMPIWLIDQALWAADDGHAEYRDFAASMLPYALPHWVGHYRDWTAKPSISGRIRTALAPYGTDDPPPHLERIAKAHTGVLRTLLTFRGRHMGITKRAYAGAPNMSGSGGGSVALLQEIIELTRAHARLTAPTRASAPS